MTFADNWLSRGKNFAAKHLVLTRGQEEFEGLGVSHSVTLHLGFCVLQLIVLCLWMFTVDIVFSGS